MTGEIFAFSAIISFTLSNAMFRKVELYFSPVQINFIRTTFGTITFVIVAAITHLFSYVSLFSARIYFLLFLSIVFAQVVGDSFYFYAQEHLGTTKALSISMTFPLFTILFSIFFLKRRLHWSIFVSAFLVVLGVLLLVYSSEPTKKNAVKVEFERKGKIKVRKIAPILFGLFASLSWAIGIVLTDLVLNEISILTNLEENSTLLGNALRFPIASFLLLVSTLFEKNKKINRKVENKKSLLFWIISASLIGTSLGAFLYAEGTRRAGSSLMSILLSASPLFSIPLTWIVNKEKINLGGFIGVVTTVAGVIVVIIFSSII